MNDPGLDLTQLRALRGRQLDVSPLLTRIEAHLERYDGYLALSGGKDSVVVAHLARQVDPNLPMAWFDSGLEFPEHRTYLHHLADAWNLNLDIITAQPTALEILVASGAWSHHGARAAIPDLRTVLIDTPAALAHERYGRGELWGVRAAESQGRRQMYATQLRRELIASCAGCCPTATTPTTQQRTRHGGTISRQDGTTAYGPIWDWSTNKVWEYLAAHNIPENPVYARLRSLGAPEHALRISTVITGTGLESGRITWLRRGWPQLYADLLTDLPRLAEFV